ncbi:MAG TPA: HU family DNA-binding protein [Gemmatimonadota bacterium]|nr:HU family DNA-binding protein [Gemmatimonadota bacterium]
MNKTGLRDAVAAKTGLTKRDAEKAINALFGTDRGGIIGNELRAGNRVQITGFGTFESRRRGARQGRNPQTGESIRIAANRYPAFKAGRGLKDRVHKK